MPSPTGTPRILHISALYVIYIVLHSCILSQSAILQANFNEAIRLISLDNPAYNISVYASLHYVTAIHPRLDTQCARVSLSATSLLAPRGAPEDISRLVIPATRKILSQNAINSNNRTLLRKIIIVTRTELFGQ